MDALAKHQIALLKELQSAGEYCTAIKWATSPLEINFKRIIRHIKRLRHKQHYVITERGREALVTTGDR